MRGLDLRIGNNKGSNWVNDDTGSRVVLETPVELWFWEAEMQSIAKYSLNEGMSLAKL